MKAIAEHFTASVRHYKVEGSLSRTKKERRSAGCRLAVSRTLDSPRCARTQAASEKVAIATDHLLRCALLHDRLVVKFSFCKK